MKRDLRNFILVMAMMLPMVLVACSDDDDVVIDSPIVGTWVSEHELLGITSTMTFNSDGTVVSIEDLGGGDVYQDRGTYTVEGNAAFINWSEEDVILDFVIDGEIMVTSMRGESGYTVWKLRN